MDIALHGEVIPAGDRVVLLARVGQPRRPGVRPSPTATTSTAPDQLQQLASFGFGRHFCLGASLARLEARVALEELVAARRAATTSTRTGIARVHSVNVRGFASLPDHAWRSHAEGR